MIATIDPYEVPSYITVLVTFVVTTQLVASFVGKNPVMHVLSLHHRLLQIPCQSVVQSLQIALETASNGPYPS